MTDLLFATPWWLPTAIVLAGVVVFISGNARQRTPMRNTGVGLVLLAMLLVLVSYLVETDKEKVTRQTRELVRAVQDKDWEKMKSLLDAKVSLATVMGSIYTNRDELVKGAQHGTEQYGLKSVTVSATEADQTEADIAVNLDVFTIQDATMGRPLPSSWRLDWGQGASDAKQWRLYRITCLKIANENSSEMRSRFPK